MWDLRKRAVSHTLPAHTNVVTSVRFVRTDDGDLLATASFDGTVRLWAAPNWPPVKTLTGHESKVMGVDWAPGGRYFATASYDRTFKLWSRGGL